MKTLLWGLGIFVGGIFILWAIVAFPYPHCSTRQIEIMKQELIDGVLVEKIQHHELYANANGKKFVQTEAFKQQLQKEKEKFYKYCDNDGVSEYKNEHCEITGSTNWNIFGRSTNRILKYHFDQESKVFFNQIQTYMGHGESPGGGYFWIADHTDQDDDLLYPVKVVGYSSDYYFENCYDCPVGYWRGTQEQVLASNKPIRKEDLVFIEAETIHYKSIALRSDSRHNSVSFGNHKFYIQREKK